jgi:hypothetical protein
MNRWADRQTNRCTDGEMGRWRKGQGDGGQTERETESIFIKKSKLHSNHFLKNLQKFFVLFFSPVFRFIYFVFVFVLFAFVFLPK